MSKKNSNNTFGNRTSDLPTCSAVLQPTAPPRALVYSLASKNFKSIFFLTATKHVIQKSVRSKFTMHMFNISNFQLLQEEHRIIFSAIPLIFRTVIATTETSYHGTNLSIPCPWTPVSFVTRPSCHDCFHLTIISKLVASKIYLQRWKRLIVARYQIKAICRMFQGSLVM